MSILALSNVNNVICAGRRWQRWRNQPPDMDAIVPISSQTAVGPMTRTFVTTVSWR